MLLLSALDVRTAQILVRPIPTSGRVRTVNNSLDARTGQHNGHHYLYRQEQGGTRRG